MNESNGGWDEVPELDTEGVDSSKVSSHIVVDSTGKYHFRIADVKPRLEPVNQNGSPRRLDILVTCEVLESVAGQSPAGSLYFHTIPLTVKGGGPPDDWAKERLSAFLCGVGVLSAQGSEVIDPETGTTKINSKTLCDRIANVKQFVGNIKCDKSDDPQYADKYELLRGRGAFQVDDPAVADVPKNLAALKEIGKESAAKPASPVKSAARGKAKTQETTAAPAASATAATATEEEFGDL